MPAIASRPGAAGRWLRTTLATMLMLYVALLGALYMGQRQLLYFPDTSIPDAARAGVPWVREMRVVTEDGLSLLAWYAAPAEPNGFVVLYLHGNGGNIGWRAGRLRRFAQAGWGALLLEYRGYGGNPGTPSEAGLAMDARAALTALENMGIGSERTLLWGESLGTGVAVGLAVERPAAALLLESPYTSVAALARQQFPFVPVDLLLEDRFDSLSRMPAVRVPVLVMQGGRDDVIPVEMGRALVAAVTAPKELWLAPQGGHNDLGARGAVEAAVAFVERRVARR